MNCDESLPKPDDIIDDDDILLPMQQEHELSRAFPTLPAATIPSSLPSMPPGEKPTLYLGAFQILAMPLSSGSLPPGFLPGMNPTGLPGSPAVFPPFKKD